MRLGLTLYLCAAFGAAACGHDAPRQNPLDPELTPAVTLEAVVHDSMGMVTLAWSPYEGEQPFAAFRVERKVQGQEEWVALDTLLAASERIYVDGSRMPDTAYDYRVVVANAAGLESPSNRESVGGYTVGAVQLLPVVADPAAGVLQVRWRRYRDPGFQAYRLARRVAGTDRDTVLLVSGAIADTSFADSSALHQVGYLYSVAVQAADRELSSAPQTGRLVLPAVTLRPPELTSATAAAALHWSPYAGPHFAAYRVERRSEVVERRVVGETMAQADTALTDGELTGNTDYSYRVTVVTDRGEEVTGEEQSGAFHRLVSAWSLDLEPGSRVRLYSEEAGRITALVSDTKRVRLLFYSVGGVLLEEQTLVQVPDALEPNTVSTALLPDGRRLLSLGKGDRAGVAVFTREGAPVRERLELFSGVQMDLPDGVAVSGDVYVRGSPRVPAGAEFFAGYFLTLDGMVLRRGEEVLWSEEFEEPVPPDWLSSQGAVRDGRWAMYTAAGRPSSYVSMDGSRWQDVRLEVEVRWVADAGVTFQLGVTPMASLSLGGSRSQPLLLHSYYVPTPGGPPKLTVKNASAEAFAPFLFLSYGVGLEAVDGQVAASIDAPVLFWEHTAAGGVRRISLASVDGRVVALADDLPFLVNEEGTNTRDPLPNLAQEVRLWERAGVPYLGVCLPEEHLVAWAITGIYAPEDQLIWPFLRITAGTVTTLGGVMGGGQGELLMPLSFDVGPDGRVYVLDAGNGRIEVFGADGGYLTEWGRDGSGAGEFDFGGGRDVEDFSGSLCVDEEGYIYVADVGYRRIQKFEP